MSQQVQTFSIRTGDLEGQEAMNRFLRGHRVLTIDREFAEGVWHFCVFWQEGTHAKVEKGTRSKVDYKELLDEKTFALFSQLREARKALAEKERLPVYAVLTNEQLAGVAKARCVSLAALRKIEGIGEGRIEKFGDVLIETVKKYAEQSTETGSHSGSGKST